MSVVVTVEDGTGLAGANSYGSVSEADAYIETRPSSDAWFDLDDEVKAQLLIHGTRILDAAMSWDYDRLTTTQALEFPRDDGAGGSTSVPAALKSALFELAKQLNATDVTSDPALSGVQSIELGPLKIVADAQRPAPVIGRFVANLLAPYGQPLGGGGSVRLVRR